MSSYVKNNFQNILITFFLIFPAHTLAMERDYSWGIEENSFLCLQIITDCVFYFYSYAAPYFVVMAALQYLKCKNHTAASGSQVFLNINLGQTVLDQTI